MILICDPGHLAAEMLHDMTSTMSHVVLVTGPNFGMLESVRQEVEQTHSELSLIVSNFHQDNIYIEIEKDTTHLFLEFICSKIAVGYRTMGKSIIHLFRKSLHPPIGSRRDGNHIASRMLYFFIRDKEKIPCFRNSAYEFKVLD